MMLFNLKNGASATAKAINKQDPLSTVGETFKRFSAVLYTKRHYKESYRSIESRLEAAICCYNSAALTDKLLDVQAAFLFLGNSDVEDSQRVSVLSSIAPKAAVVIQNTDEATPIASTDDSVNSVMSQIKYNDTASIIRSFNKIRVIPKSSNTTFSAHSSFAGNMHFKTKKRFLRKRFEDRKSKHRLSPGELADL